MGKSGDPRLTGLIVKLVCACVSVNGIAQKVMGAGLLIFV